jgi:hypothetical protein
MTHPAVTAGSHTKWFLPPWLCQAKLTEYNIPDRQNFTSAIPHILDEIEQEILMTVFETWINRLWLVIEHEGEYLHQEMKNERKCLKIQ